MKSVAITAASSFTGHWIVRALTAAGWKVHALFSLEESEYKGLRKARVDALSSVCERHFGIRAEDGSMADWIRKNSPSFWIHHHHVTKNFSEPEYNAALALSIGLGPLDQIVKALKENSCSGLVFSGSYLETKSMLKNAHPHMCTYIASKKQVWERIAVLASTHALPISKIYIPNPVGPLEDEFRLIPSLVSCARNRTRFLVRYPNYEVEQYPVEGVANAYAHALERLREGHTDQIFLKGWRGCVKGWVQKVNAELIEQVLGLPGVKLDFLAETPLLPIEENQMADWLAVWESIAAHGNGLTLPVGYRRRFTSSAMHARLLKERI